MGEGEIVKVAEGSGVSVDEGIGVLVEGSRGSGVFDGDPGWVSSVSVSPGSAKSVSATDVLKAFSSMVAVGSSLVGRLQAVRKISNTNKIRKGLNFFIPHSFTIFNGGLRCLFYDLARFFFVASNNHIPNFRLWEDNGIGNSRYEDACGKLTKIKMIIEKERITGILEVENDCTANLRTA